MAQLAAGQAYDFGECNDDDGNPRWEAATTREECSDLSFRDFRACARQFTTWYNACEDAAGGNSGVT